MEDCSHHFFLTIPKNIKFQIQIFFQKFALSAVEVFWSFSLFLPIFLSFLNFPIFFSYRANFFWTFSSSILHLIYWNLLLYLKVTAFKKSQLSDFILWHGTLQLPFNFIVIEHVYLEKYVYRKIENPLAKNQFSLTLFKKISFCNTFWVSIPESGP